MVSDGAQSARGTQAEHPLVRVHPETGERTLVSGHFIKSFIGYNTQDSDHLFALFQNHITRLENTVRWRWQAGDVPVAVDGQRSRARQPVTRARGRPEAVTLF